MDLQELRIVLEHLVDVVLGVELTHAVQRKRASHHDLFGGIRVQKKVTWLEADR